MSFNPAVLPLAIVTIALAIREAAGRLTGRWLNITHMHTRTIATTACAITIGGLWVWQQRRFDFLVQSAAK